MSVHGKLTRLCNTLMAAAIAMVLASAALAQGTQSADEIRVKAAFLLRFAQFVVWPSEALPQADTPLVIGVVGADPIAAELAPQAAGSRAALGRPVTVRVVKPGEDPPPLHLLFVGGDARLAQYVNATRGKRVLLVTDAPGALEHGSMINFVIADRRVKFEIALEPAEKAGLTLSSRLLAVAMRVLKGELRLEPFPVAARMY